METSNISEEEETQEKTEKPRNESFDARDEVITLLPNRGDNTDFPSGNIPAQIQKDAQESNSYKCSNFNKKTYGNVHSEESNQTEEAGTMSQTLS